MTQCEEILNHLKMGRSITALYALREFGCFRLAARISELRKEWDIHSEPWSYKTERGETKTIARYTLAMQEYDEEPLSDCCGASIHTDTDICSECKEHCGVQEEEITEQERVVIIYQDLGFTELRTFRDEYVLLINKNLDTVRIYEDGHVLVTDPITGVYKRVTAGMLK